MTDLLTWLSAPILILSALAVIAYQLTLAIRACLRAHRTRTALRRDNLEHVIEWADRERRERRRGFDGTRLHVIRSVEIQK